ncbi:MAG TPA: WD40 repeat domain-containing protein, partial [Gemmataceae bacterium]|nr:WD40 repeat domain-containing protein [Gemmataceae bacterium]
ALADGSVLVWDVARPAESRRAGGDAVAGGVKELRFSPDGRLLAAACWGGEIRLWDPATTKLLKVLKHHAARIADVVFSPDGKALAAEASDSSGSLWDVDPSSATFGKLRAPLPDLKALLDPGLRVWSPDGKLLAVLTTDRQPRTVDGATGAVRQTLPVHDANMLEMAFAADGQTLVVRTASGRVRAWDGLTGKELDLPTALPATAETLVGSSGGWVALATATRVVLWRGPGGKAPAELAAPRRAGPVAFSADGQTVATGGAALRVWRHAGGEWRAVDLPRQPDDGPFNLLDVSADGRTVLVQTTGRAEVVAWEVDAGKGARVATAGAGGARPVTRLVPGKPLVLVRGMTGSVGLVNPLEGRMVRLHSANAEVNVVVASPDGRTTVTGAADGSLRWYAGPPAGPPRYTADAHGGRVTLLSLSRDGKRLLSAGGADQVALWDCSGEPKLLRAGTLREVSAAEWSPDGTKVAVGSQRGEVQEWDAGGAGARTLQQAPLNFLVPSLALSRDGRTFLALDDLRTGRVYDTTGRGLLATLPGVTGLAVSPDGRWLAACDTGGAVRLHDRRSGKDRDAPLPLPPALAGVTALAFSPDGRTLSVACRDNTVRTWDLTTDSEGARFPPCHWITFSGDGRRRVGVTAAGSLVVWDAATGQEKAHWPANNGQGSVSNDGQVIVLHAGNSPPRLFDVAAGGEPVTILKELGNQVSGAVVSPDGQTVIVTTHTGRVHFWDRARGADRAVVVPREGVAGGAGMLAFADKGRGLVAAGGTGGLHYWDVASARERFVLTAADGTSPVSHFQLSGDGSTLVAAYYDGSVRVFDATPAAERPPLTGHTGPVVALALSADGKRLASAGEDRTVRVYDPAAPTRATAVLRGARTPVLGVAISPDGRTVAGSCADGRVYLWPAEARDELATLHGHAGWAVRLRYLPGGKRVLSSGGDGLRLWELDKSESKLFAQGRQNNQIDLSADGKRCLSPYGTEVHEWDLDGGQPVREFKGLTNNTVWVVLYLSGDKEVLAASGDGRTLVWERATGKVVSEFERPGGFARCGAVSPDGKWLATGDGRTGRRRDALRVWDPATGKVVRGFGDYRQEVCFVAWSPDGKRLAVAGADATVRVFDAATGAELKRIKAPTWVDSVAWLPGGRRVLSTGNNGDNLVHLWDVETGTELRRFAGHTEPAITVAVAPDGRTALSAGKDGTLRQWSLAPTDPVVLSAHEGEAWAVAFSPDGKLLATAGADRAVRLWDVSGDRERPGYGRPVRTLAGAAQGLLAVAFSPDGKRVAAGEGDLFLPRPGAVRLWDVDSGEPVAALRGHTGAVRAVAFSPDGKRLASGGGDGTIRLWDTRDGSPRGEWHGHKTEVTGLAFDRAGRLLASAGAASRAPAQPGEVLLWDVATGRQRGPLVGHTAGLTGVGIAPDGTALYASAYDETVRVWSLPPVR